jgi:hypothetical protein
VLRNNHGEGVASLIFDILKDGAWHPVNKVFGKVHTLIPTHLAMRAAVRQGSKGKSANDYALDEARWIYFKEQLWNLPVMSTEDGLRRRRIAVNSRVRLVPEGTCACGAPAYRSKPYSNTLLRCSACQQEFVRHSVADNSPRTPSGEGADMGERDGAGGAMGEVAASDWTTVDDYVDRLIVECDLSRGAAEAEVEDALESLKIRRRGWINNQHRLAQRQDFGRDPGPGPVLLPRAPARPIWLERNVYDRVEYSLSDLDYQLRRLRRRQPQIAKPERPEQAILNRELLKLAMERGQKVKQGDDEAGKILEKLRATYDQKIKAFRSLPESYSYRRGRPGKPSA